MVLRISDLAQREQAALAALTEGGGEMGERIAELDWSRTPLGPVAQWPESLRAAVRIVLTAHQPMFVWWGPQLINIYNDSYRAILGGKHPAALARPAQEVWREVWPTVEPRASSAMSGTAGTYDEALLLVMERNGYPEETYYTFSYSPIPGPDGSAGGILCANTDETRRMQGEREINLQREIAARTASARNTVEACHHAAAALATDRRDFPFALIYCLDPDQGVWRLAGHAGIAPGSPLAPLSIVRHAESPWPIELARSDRRVRVVSAAPSARWPRGELPIAPVRAAVCYVGTESSPAVLIAGLSPLRRWGGGFDATFALVANQVASGLAHAQAYDEQHRRAEQLADLDRAKTAFFTNVSHELRTPLTLILGPADEALNDVGERLGPHQRERIVLVQANATRLLRQVNALLDFTQLQTGRIEAVFEPTYLARFTTGLASAFEAAAQRAGLKLELDCRIIPDPVYLDRRLWETVVFNLLANAIKYTASGTITVRLYARGEEAVLEVADTGIGIPQLEQAHLFERFYRVPGARGRTHEGTGIGLALVRQITELHGGRVDVESEPGRGSTFRVAIPRGTAHLPAGQIGAAHPTEQEEIEPGRVVLDFVEQAEHWVTAAADVSAKSDRPRILVAEDNRDMRLYLNRLLVQDYDVREAADGEQALALIRQDQPELVLSDIMMPGLDGFALLRAIRADPAMASIPVILLSARAGEGARSAGMEASADDYLVKPFHARELLARVGAHIKLRRLRLDLYRQLAQTEELHRQLLESIQAGFVYLDQDLVIRYVNHPIEQIVRRRADDLLGRNLYDAFPSARGTQIESCLLTTLRQRQACSVEEYFPPADFWVRVSAFPAPEGGLAILAQDVSAEKRQQQSLLLSEKLAAAGKLAATVAHEINNPLAAAMNLVYLSRIAPDRAAIHLETAERELRRVANLANQTLSFYRRPSAPTRLHLPELLQAALQIYETKLRSRGIAVHADFQPAPAISGSSSELQQVFVNLISNAVDAMPQGGELRIELAPAAAEDAPGVWIRVGDTGPGVRPELRDRLFEPFFTTKKNVGTGLGLWIVHHIVTEHRGRITVSEGPGAVFSVYLPGSAK